MLRKTFLVLCLIVLIIAFIYIGKNKLAAFYNNTGVDYFTKGSYKKAILYFKKSLRLASKNPVTHFNLANTYRENNLTEGAINEYKKAILLNQRYDKAYKALGKIYLSRKMYRDAFTQFKQGTAINPNDNEMKELSANVYSLFMLDLLSESIESFLAKDKNRAYNLLNKALSIKPDFAYSHYLLGYFYYADNKFDTAILKLKKSLELDPKYWFANKLLGDIYFKKRDFFQAINEYQSALAINPNDASLYNDIGLALVQLERYPQSIYYLEQAIKLAPENLNMRYNLANVYRDNNLQEKALAEYDKIPGFPNVHNEKASIYINQGKMKQASEEYKKEIQACNRRIASNPNDIAALNDLAEAYAGIKRYEAAELIINKLIDIAPDYRHAYITLATIQKYLGKNDEAIKTIKKAKSLTDRRNSMDDDSAEIRKFISNFADETFFEDLDKVYLKNGRVFEGKIKSETAEKLILEIKIGGSAGNIILYTGTIERVVKAEPDKAGYY